MAPPEHVLIGFSLGNIFYALQEYAGKGRLPYAPVLFLSGVMAALPDVDSLFGHYGSTNVFLGHRGITHSLLFVFIVSAAVALAIRGMEAAAGQGGEGRRRTGGSAAWLIFPLLFAAGLSHLLGDLPQPSGPWGGIPLFFPLSSGGNYVRTGGWALTGWYDYRVMVLLSSAFLVSLASVLLMMVSRKQGWRAMVRLSASLLMAGNCAAIVLVVYLAGHGGYVNAGQWGQLQSEYLDRTGPLVKGILLNGRECFMKLFMAIR